MRTLKTFAERLSKHTDATDPERCWEWGGTRDRDGYGMITWKGKTRQAHRVSYEEHHGMPIPEGLQIDHLCRNQPCVNPKHLEAVTPRTNALRSNSVSGINARKTHCFAGHPYDETNTYRYGNQRRCRACNRAMQAAVRTRRTA